MKKLTSTTFPQGGIHPVDNKLTADKPIQDLGLPESVSVHLTQHIGKPATAIVQTGDTVKAGQLIAKADGFISASLHAPVSGRIEKFIDVMDQTGYKKKAVIIKTTGDEWQEGIDLSSDLISEIQSDREAIIQKIAQAGIIGMGGAGFPSHVKLQPPKDKTIEYLLINGVECEPFLTSDHRLMLEKSRELIVGIQILLKALKINKARVGVEENKQDAIELLRQHAANDPRIEIHPLKVWYPQGGERQLVKALTNREIPPPPKGLPHDTGCAVFNVATTFAVYEAVQKNKPCVERIVTVTGYNLTNPGNFRVRIGTSVTQLIQAAGGLPDNAGKILSGGPMMGKALPQTDIPITKTMGGIVILPEDQAQRKPSVECIRCAKCVSVCPLGLEPYLLMTLSDKELWERAQEEKMLSCCECACCQFICPSHRPLLDYIRRGKAVLTQILLSAKTK